jgi:hypothetical protein
MNKALLHELVSGSNDCLDVCFCSIGDTYRIGFHPFGLIFELKVIPFWCRLLEPMIEQIGYQVLVQTLG